MSLRYSSRYDVLKLHQPFQWQNNVDNVTTHVAVTRTLDGCMKPAWTLFTRARFSLTLTVLTSVDTDWCWHWLVLTLTSVDTEQCWHWLVLTLIGVDADRCWHWPVLTLTGVDADWCWHWPVLTLTGVDTDWRWHCHWLALTLTLTDIDTDRRWHRHRPALTLTLTGVDADPDQHWHWHWPALTLTLTGIDTDTDRRWHWPWPALTLTLTGVDACSVDDLEAAAPSTLAEALTGQLLSPLPMPPLLQGPVPLAGPLLGPVPLPGPVPALQLQVSLQGVAAAPPPQGALQRAVLPQPAPLPDAPPHWHRLWRLHQEGDHRYPVGLQRLQEARHPLRHHLHHHLHHFHYGAAHGVSPRTQRSHTRSVLSGRRTRQGSVRAVLLPPFVVRPSVIKSLKTPLDFSSDFQCDWCCLFNEFYTCSIFPGSLSLL